MKESTRTNELNEYRTPELIVHGTLGDLTQGTAGQVPDTAQASQPLP